RKWFKEEEDTSTLLNIDEGSRPMGSEMIEEDTTPSREVLEPNVQSKGMLFPENRETGVEEWTFLFEPGVTTSKLNFNENSICVLDDGPEICDMENFDWNKYDMNTYFDLVGYKEDNKNEITVIKLILHRI
ncbi:hypothetical protein ACFL13_03050, partial [Patescibacteria group bacterium]